jgi:DNA-binding response OmpR family regulator
MNGPRILVVDDDRSACAIVSRLLSTEGYQVQTAHDGATALDAIDSNDFELAILDYQMPGMNGVELCQRLRELKPDMATIFLTAFATINTVYPAIGAGAERVLSKPVNFEELLPLVQELVGSP